MSSMREDIRNTAAELCLDEQAAGLLCPFCKGGATGERTLSVIRRATKAEYFCHRASCAKHGNVNMVGTALIIGPKKPVVKFIDYTENLVKLPSEVEFELQKVIDKTEIYRQGLLWAPDYDGKGKGRVAIPIRSRYGPRIGWVFRTLDKSIKPKARILLTDAENPCMSWYRKDAFSNFGDYPVVLVEDVFSAIKASKHCNSIALLGTALSSEKIAAIQSTAPKRLLIALDEDATAKSADFVAKIFGLFNNVEIRMLSKDLKDCTDDEVKEALKL